MKTKMKTLVRTALTITTLCSASSYAAGPTDSAQLILNNAAIRALGTEINRNHGGTCTVPTQPQDISWECTGALPPVNQPSLAPSGCGFNVEVRCQDQTHVRISGGAVTYLLVMPDHSIAQSAGPIITIDDVTYETPGR
jgi:hypothetical protein